MKEKRRFRFPIRVKTVLMIVLFALVIVEVAMTFYSVIMSSNNKESSMKNADNLSGTISEVLDVDKVEHLKNEVKTIVDNSSEIVYSDDWGSDAWNAYIAQFDAIKNDPVFIEIQELLRRIQANNSKDVTSLYLSFVDNVKDPNGYFVYLVDSAPDEDACPPGCIDPLYDINKKLLEDPHRGFPAYITNTEEYGWLVTSGSAITKGDEVIGYAMVDLSMTAIRARQADRIVRLFFYLLASVIAISAIGITIVHIILVKPIKKLTNAAASYDIYRPEETHEIFENLEIKTHDEIAELAKYMKIMESDINKKLKELTQINIELLESQKETAELSILARKDGLTGVQNKISYNSDVKKMDEAIAKGELKEFGIIMVDLNYLKLINDVNGHNAGDAALINLTKLICEIFDHSPVYRVGGDEFVAILKDRDYNDSKELIDKFNEEIEKVRDHLSAAIGYAKFDPEKDKSVKDVFARADREMYSRKHEMKVEDGNE